MVLPDETQVAAASLSDASVPRSRPPDVGLYCDARWQPPWPFECIDWADFRLPANFVKAADHIREAYESARSGKQVEIGCAQGLGRTGTMLACMAVLAGKKPQRAIEWVRDAYEESAIEGPDQEWWVKWFASDVLAMKVTSASPKYENPPLRPRADHRRFSCYFRSACHAVFREARHIAPGAHCGLGGEYAAAIAACAVNAAVLDSRDPWEQTQDLDEPAAVLGIYESLTGLSLEDLLAIFQGGDWDSGYGGKPWGRITKLVIELGRSLEAKDDSRCRSACSQLLSARHNNGSVVPPLREWESELRLQRKWPRVCDAQ